MSRQYRKKTRYRPPKKPKPRGTCGTCGYTFDLTPEGRVPTHDWPKPTRQVCPGAGQEPKMVTQGGKLCESCSVHTVTVPGAKFCRTCESNMEV